MKQNRDIYTVLFIVMCVLATIAGAAVAMIFIPTASAEELTCVAPNGQYVNVRNRPRSDAQKVGEMHNGDKIDAVSVSGGWIEIVYKNKTAYVSADYFEAPEADGGALYSVNANGRVRVRATPGGKRVDWAEPGATTRVFGWRYGSDDGKWARCTSGYISSSCLTPAQGSEQP